MSKLLTNTSFLYQLFTQTNLFPYPSDTTDSKFWKKDRKGNPIPSKNMLKQHERAKDAMCRMVAESVNAFAASGYGTKSACLDTEDFLFSSTEIKALFGRMPTFYEWNDTWKVFDKSAVHLSAKYAGYNNAKPCGYIWNLQFKSKLASLMESIANDTCTVRREDIEKAPHEVPEEYDLVTYITPNIQALRETITSKEFSLDARLYAWAYCQVAEYYNGRVPQYYHKTKNSDRYYGFGKLNIQCCPKKLRNVIMSGYNQYDFANSTSKCDTRLCRLTVLFEYLDRLPESETFPRS